MDQDDFDEDLDFGDLPPNTLDTLEQHARLFASSQLPAVASPRFHAPTSGRISQPQRPAAAYPKTIKAPSSDYGFDDEDVIDLDAQKDPATVRNVSRPGQRGLPQPSLTQHAAIVTEDAADQELDVDALKARVLELEQNRVALQKYADDANAAALARAGEISIVRANRDRAEKEFEARIAALQKSHGEEAAKAKADLDAARREREKFATSNKFLEHDLAQEAERARTLKKTLNDTRGSATAGPHSSPLSTPRKNKALAFRDGFDDDEVLLVSPSKAKDRSKPSTPRAGAKRKRAQVDKKPNDSPKLPLLKQVMADDGLAALPNNSPKPPEPTSVNVVDHSAEKFELMQSVLNHRSDPDGERCLEILTKFYLPSAVHKSLSSLVYDNLALKSAKQDFEQYRLDLCNTLMSIWSQCLTDLYYAPLYELSQLVQYILMISPSSLSTTLISRLVPLCQTTADVVAVPVAKASKVSPTKHTTLTSPKENINPLDHVSLLHFIAINCETAADLYTFWSAMEFDFVLLMLHKAQPIEQMTEMLELLSTSILDNTFGAITTPTSPSQGSLETESTVSPRHAKQEKMENDILDRLTVLLFEIPQRQHRPPDQPASIDKSHEQQAQDDLHNEPPPHTPASLLPLRTTVLSLLHTLSRTPHGADLLIGHRLAIPRLARFLHESLLQMYAYFPSAAHPATAACVNTTVLMLTHLDGAESGAGSSLAANTGFSPGAVRAKLATAPGGLQRWLVCLSRVAFAEGVGAIEAGLLPYVREVAHKVLDEMLSPEEGEGVLGVFL